MLYPFLYFAQEKLLFIQQKKDSEHLSWVTREYPHAEEVRIKTPDNVLLQGWYIKNSPEQQSPLVIYFGGNAEEISKHIREINYFKGWALLLVNYRGYGLSEGNPSETNFFKDAVLLYDTFAKRIDIDNQKIVAFGRSLGTGVAVYLAHQRDLKGLILVSPYDSIRSIAQEIYPYVPVSLLLKHHFDSLILASSIKIPMLALIAQNDRIIPPSHSFKLIEAWGGVARHTVITDSHHNNITMSYEYWESIIAFLDSLLKV
ncbi:alpha/beta hydrolase [Candidatus Parabeggiatoa sp. HSG14]|uniref:alpha/beta hydrolase n=1 Tax=Candidatus Parabeggiatoa sp. HSG14 TaxID=3055593 RepID=UPI0032E4DD17